MREYIHAITNHTFSKIFFLAVFGCYKHEQINLTYHQRLLPFLGTTGMNDDDDDNKLVATMVIIMVVVTMMMVVVMIMMMMLLLLMMIMESWS